MAAMQKVEEFDVEGLKKLRKSLICDNCKRPPRPGASLYTCFGNLYCRKIRCNVCTPDIQNEMCHNYKFKYDEKLTAFVWLFKFHNCGYINNGCQEELEAKSLEAHEKVCLFRDVTCPKLDCNAKIAFNGIMDHFQSTHTDVEIKDDVLEFKGSLKDLKKNNFILNSYGKPFFPQFYVNGKLLHFWVVGHGNQDEISSFEVNNFTRIWL